MKHYVKSSTQAEMLNYIDLSLSNITTAVDLSIDNIGQYLQDAEDNMDDFDVIDDCLQDIEIEIKNLLNDVCQMHNNLIEQMR